MIQIEQIFPSLTWRIRHETMYPEQDFDIVKLEQDFEGYHFGLYENHVLVGVVSLFIENKMAQFRKFAVLPQAQGKGYGKHLMLHLINFCKTNCIEVLWCHARVNALGFYKKNGFEKIDLPFSKNQIEYVKMCLTIS